MTEHGTESDAATYCGAQFGEVREGECECTRHAAYPDPLQDWPMPGYLKPDAMSTSPAATGATDD